MSANLTRLSVRRPFKLFALCGAFSVLLCVQSGCNKGPQGPVTVPLVFRSEGTRPISGSLSAADVRVHLEAIEDKRQNKDQIGSNTEDEVPVPIYSSGKTPVEFVRDVMKQELENFGVSMTDAPEAADRILSLDLNKFFVEETSRFVAQVNANAEVRDKGGRVLWKGTVAGSGSTSGRSLNPENYQQTLSEATMNLVGSLLNNPKFQEALTR